MKYYAIYNTKTQQLSKAQCRCLNKEVQNIEITKYEEEELSDGKLEGDN